MLIDSVYRFRLSEISSSSGGGAIFVEANSSVYIRDNVYGGKNYEPVTTDLYVNPRNFDMVKIEGRTDPRDCPLDLTGTYHVNTTMQYTVILWL